MLPWMVADTWSGKASGSGASGTIDAVCFTEIKYNPSTNYRGTAVAAFGNDDVDITNSTFDEIGRIGVLYFGTGISGSLFADNTYTGKGTGDHLDYTLDISAGAVVDVYRNTISGNMGTASADGSKSAGVLVSTFFASGTEADIQNNFITGNTCGITVGVNSSETSSVEAHFNDLSGNTLYAISNTSASDTIAATCNWYGATDSTVADMINGLVTYEPFLNSGTDFDESTNGFSRQYLAALTTTPPVVADIVGSQCSNVSTLVRSRFCRIIHSLALW
ncbi:MAG: hypothetical protein R3B47_12990 [Bacteroidia bacterium]